MDVIENTLIVAWSLRWIIAATILALAGAAYAERVMARIPGGTPPPQPHPRRPLVLTVLRGDER